MLNKIQNIINKFGMTVLIIVTAFFVYGMIYMINYNEPQIMAVIDGRDVCIVESREQLENSINALCLRINEEAGVNYKFDRKISYRFVCAPADKIADENEIEYALLGCIHESIKEVYALYIDDKFVSAANTYDEIYEVINKIESLKTAEAQSLGYEFDKIKIANKIEIRDQLCSVNEIHSAEEIALMLDGSLNNNAISENNSNNANMLYTASFDVSADTVPETSAENDGSSEVITSESLPESNNSSEYGISRSNDSLTGSLRLYSVEASPKNPSLKAVAKPGELSSVSASYLNNGGALIKYALVKNIAQTEEVPFEINYIDSADYFEGTEIITQYGKNGLRDVTYSIEYIDGKESKRSEISENIIESPVTQIVIRGIKEPPESKAYGTFLWPSETLLVTSEFGERELLGEQNNHRGIDIAAPDKSEVFASDGGIVIFAGYDDSYGNYIIIRHDALFTTLYSHLSEILVSENDPIYPGQLIGKVGDTGTVTGPHLHFEIRTNGVSVNPRDYID